MKTVYRLDLTPHERAALLTVIADYITMPGAIEVSIEAHTGAEIPLGQLLARVIDLTPLPADAEAKDEWVARTAQEMGDLAGKVQHLVNWLDGQGLLEEHVFTFPDGDTWQAGSA